MSACKRRIISFGGSAVAVEYAGPRTAALVDFLYRHVPPGSDVEPCVTYRVECDVPGKITLYRNGAPVYEGDSEATAADLLLGLTCFHLTDHSHGGLLFHAAALAWQGRGLMLPGQIGAGKTTLAAWLVTKGCDYLTDELVFMPDGAQTMQAFSRPLNLKKGSWRVLQPHLDLTGHPAQLLKTCCVALVPPTLLRPANLLSEPPVNLILFPRYALSEDFALRPLSKAQAGLALMQCLVNARNLPERGFPGVARLARAAPAFALHYSSLDQLEGHIEALLPSP
jgi:hypothetical protein